MRKILSGKTLVGAFVMYPLIAFAGTLVPVPSVPGAQETIVLSINNQNVLTGYYSNQADDFHAFVGTLDGRYTLFDYKANDTQGVYINENGQVTGWAVERDSPWFEYQFIRNPDGTTTPITLNGKHPRGSGRPGELTDNNLVVGNLEPLKRNGQYSKSRSYSGLGTNYTDEIVLPFKGVKYTWATGANNHGDMVGYFALDSSGGIVHGFLIRDGVATQIDYPDPREVSTEILSINNKGLMVGYYTDTFDSRFPFVFNRATGGFRRLPVDYASTISNSGLVAVTLNGEPYIYCLTDKHCPQGPRPSIHLADHWTAGNSGNMRAVMCANRCRRAFAGR